VKLSSIVPVPIPLAVMPLISVSPGSSNTPAANAKVRQSVSSGPSPMAASPSATGSDNSKAGSVTGVFGLSVTICAGATKAGPAAGTTFTTISVCAAAKPGAFAVRVRMSVLLKPGSLSRNPARAAFTSAALPPKVIALPVSPPALTSAPATPVCSVTLSVTPAAPLMVMPGGRFCSEDEVVLPPSTVRVAGAEMFNRLVTAGA
jgi:hypothetical protein